MTKVLFEQMGVDQEVVYEVVIGPALRGSAEVVAGLESPGQNSSMR